MASCNCSPDVDAMCNMADCQGGVNTGKESNTWKFRLLRMREEHNRVIGLLDQGLLAIREAKRLLKEQKEKNLNGEQQ